MITHIAILGTELADFTRCVISATSVRLRTFLTQAMTCRVRDITAATCVHLGATVRPDLNEDTWIPSPYIGERYDEAAGLKIQHGHIPRPKGPKAQAYPPIRSSSEIRLRVSKHCSITLVRPITPEPLQRLHFVIKLSPKKLIPARAVAT